MTKRQYRLPATTVAWFETTVGIEVRCASTFSKWVYDLSRQILVSPFKFYWTERPGTTEHYDLIGSFCPEYRRDGIYVVVNLCLEDRYNNEVYTLAEFCRLISKGTRPYFGWCVTVKV